MSVYDFITQPYRFSEASDNTIRSLFPTARQVEIDGYMTNTSDADALTTTLFTLLKAQRRLYEVPVLGVNVVKPSDFDGSCLCATLFSNRFGLSAGKLVAVVGFSLELNQGTTTFQVWG